MLLARSVCWVCKDEPQIYKFSGLNCSDERHLRLLSDADLCQLVVAYGWYPLVAGMFFFFLKLLSCTDLSYALRCCWPNLFVVKKVINGLNFPDKWIHMAYFVLFLFHFVFLL